MADTFAALKTELAARGTDYLEPVRAARFINRGYQMLCEEYPWPFLETSVTNTAPFDITDLREVLSVSDVTNNAELSGEDPRAIVTLDPDANATGAPEAWYVQGDTFNVYPSSPSTSVTVRYIQVPPELEDDTDEPLVPQRYRNLITDAAYYLALKDNDEFASAQALKAMYDAEVAQMITRLSIRDLQNPPQIVVDPWSFA